MLSARLPVELHAHAYALRVGSNAAVGLYHTLYDAQLPGAQRFGDGQRCLRYLAVHAHIHVYAPQSARRSAHWRRRGFKGSVARGERGGIESVESSRLVAQQPLAHHGVTGEHVCAVVGLEAAGETVGVAPHLVGPGVAGREYKARGAVLHIERHVEVLVAVFNVHGPPRREESHAVTVNGVGFLLQQGERLEVCLAADCHLRFGIGVGEGDMAVVLHWQVERVGGFGSVHLVLLMLREIAVVGVECEVHITRMIGEDILQRTLQPSAERLLCGSGQLGRYLGGDVGAEPHGVVDAVVVAALRKVFVNARGEARGGKKRRHDAQPMS